MGAERMTCGMMPFGRCSGSTSFTVRLAPFIAMTDQRHASRHALSGTLFLSIPNLLSPFMTKPSHSVSPQSFSTPLSYTAQPNRNWSFWPFSSPNISL